MHRRDFLKVMGAGLASLGAGSIGVERARASLPPDDLKPGEAALVSEFRRDLEAMFQGREMALDFRRINRHGVENFRIQINNQKLYPVASAFKAFLVLYYFMRTPLQDWVYAPDSSVYRTAVFSNNSETGRLMYEMGERVPGPGNAVEKFNNFLRRTLKFRESGMFSWSWPNTPTFGMLDERYRPVGDRLVTVYENQEDIGNIFTTEELAKGYEFIVRAEEHPDWQTDDHFREAIRATRELLAIAAPGYKSPIEQVLYSGYIGKDGTLPLGDIPLGRVINDAGIINVPDAQYILAFMSTAENESSTKPALQKVIDSMRQFEETYYPSGSVYLTGQSHRVYKNNQYNYGFVRRQEIALYSEPDLNAARVDNPVRRNTVFGLMYLMQGAMVRFIALDDEWGEIIRDDDFDKTFSWEDWTFGFSEANWVERRPERIFVRIEDLLVVGYEKSTPIGLVSGEPEGTSKFIIMDVPRRQLTLFENSTPILKTPIVLNMDATPRGLFYIHRVYMTRNMPNYPGVPYSSFLHDGKNLHEIGYAIHGAPWHRWSETVTRRETVRRYSHGCINLPNWTRQIGNYELPVDEFVFRWMGGFPAPETERHHFPTGLDVVRVFSHNNVYSEIFNFPLLDSLRGTRQTWNDVLHNFDQKQIDAPPSFFEETLL